MSHIQEFWKWWDKNSEALDSEREALGPYGKNNKISV